ncbi:MAG: dephospho-CoA kinase [Desulfonatronovibrio sp.]
MNQQIEFSVDTADSAVRLDKLILKYFPDEPPARSQVQSWIRQGLVRVDGVQHFKPSQTFLADQKVVVQVPVAAREPAAVKGKVEEVYRDEHILVLNKQPGLSVHPASSVAEPTLVNYLLDKYPWIRDTFSGDRPGIVHRLDKDTSGLMVVALDPGSEKKLAASFHDRQVGKNYLAVIKGCPEKNQGEITLPLGRDPVSKTRMAVVKTGRQAITRYQVIYSGKDKKWSMVKVEILTGRTHQIRVHLAEKGHPVLGDFTYGSRSDLSMDCRGRFLTRLVRRQLLHSLRLEFNHPATGQEMSFKSLPPKDFLRTFLCQERVLQRVIITGAMGSGKSSVLFLLKEMGYPVFSADECVAELYRPGNDGWRIIRNRFGTRFIEGEDQPVNKQKLARAIEKDPAILAELNHLIHPLVKHRLEEFWNVHACERVAFAEIPLVFESRMEQGCGLVAGVFCPDKARHHRLSKTGKMLPEEPALLDSSQMKQADKIRRCDLVVDNSSDLNNLRSKVQALTRVLSYLRTKDATEKFRFFRELLQSL